MFRTIVRNSGLPLLLVVVLVLIAANAAVAAPPVVKTVPWVATNPLIPHDTYDTKAVRLKGACDMQGGDISYTWDFGDFTAVSTGTVTNMRAIEALHTYSAPVGTVFTARLTVTNTTTGETGSKEYYVAMRAKSLQVEVNIAIDEGLWHLHKRMVPYLTDQGYWASYYNTETPAALNAFFVNGHTGTGDPSNPYTDTVKRGMRRLFTLLSVISISSQNYSAPIGTVNPDSNGNGIGIQGYDTVTYSGGIFMDAIVASGTPTAIAPTGPANVIGRTYKDIVQDMVDAYAYGQTDTGSWMGGWGYGWWNNSTGSSDNSVNQWAVIGLLAARDNWGVIVPSFIGLANQTSLANTHSETASEIWFNYTNNGSSGWGIFATTPSGMVQMVFDGIGRGSSLWDKTENYMRNNFCNTGGSYYAVRDYYYGLFSFTKSMLLYPGGIQYLANQPGGANPIDWYSAEASAGAPCNGVARTLVNAQLADGNWNVHGGDGYHNWFQAAWAIIMLNRTVFSSGVPVAVAQATPNPGVATSVITLSGSASFHQDVSKSIVAWDWDLDNNGTFETPGVVVTKSWPALGDYPVGLRVKDNSVPQLTATTSVTVRITTPPVAPTANAGGPYVFCVTLPKLFLDGSKTVNPDEGQHAAGLPGDTIYQRDGNGVETQFMWDLNGDNVFGDVLGIFPDVTTYYQTRGPGTYLASLKVCDTTAASFGAGLSDLCSISSTQVTVTNICPTCTTLRVIVSPNGHSLMSAWTKNATADHYNIYRGTVSGGPYVYIGTTKKLSFSDSNTVKNTTYYYVVRVAVLNGNETCQSNQASGTPVR